jgi:2-polyprenyl-3-methyl-5-hydroxy-6-metoxy-1,4-benzoquinol methylase
VSEIKHSYATKSIQYFSNVRTDIVPLLEGPYERVLDVGCGSGDTLHFLKQAGYSSWTAGIELFPEAARSAREKGVDHVIEGSIEGVVWPFTLETFDLVLCLDVLEHLSDPWSVIAKLHALMAPGGTLICSIPNVRHVKIVLPLLFAGQWTYTDWGLLDRTHLRFFTKSSAIDLLESSGLAAEQVVSKGITGKYAVANTLTFGALRPLLEYQYLIRCRNVG